MPKTWVGRTTLNGEKNSEWPYPKKKIQYQGRDYIDLIFVSFKSLCYGRYQYRKIALTPRK